jgi:phosphate uptake regulator
MHVDALLSLSAVASLLRLRVVGSKLVPQGEHEAINTMAAVKLLERIGDHIISALGTE